jgi:integrase/uncharacterized coiled-coil protein SlyX
MKAREDKGNGTVNLEQDKYVQRWLAGKKPNTVESYKLAMRLYLDFTKKIPEELILEKWNDMKKTPIEQTDVAENRLRGFYSYLTEEYTDKRGRHLSAGSAKIYVRGAIASFYQANKVPLIIKSSEFEGAPRAENETEKMRPEQIEKLAYYAPTPRDKAIIWVGFQGGMDVSTLAGLNWGHVEKEIENPPLGAILLRGLLRTKIRGKATGRFSTCIYKTAVQHLRKYLEKQYGEDYAKKLKYDDPLFLGRHGKRIVPGDIQKMLRKIAPQSEIASGRLSHSDINPLRPHALRASFSDQMTKAGASKQFVDYLMGHKLSYGDAYFGGEQRLAEAYVKYAEQALEPKGLTPNLEKTLEEQKDTIVRLENQLTQTQKAMEPLSKALERLVEQVGEEEASKQLTNLFIWLGERQLEKQMRGKKEGQ